MTKNEFWSITIHFFPEATKAGLNPCEVLRFQFSERDWQPNFYISHTINFQHPPTRQDFLNVIHATPWMMSNWEKTLVPLIEQPEVNPWPMVYEQWEKAASSNITSNGKVVGRLYVRREDVLDNNRYYCPPITSEDRKDATRGLKGENKTKADNAIMTGDIKNRVREKLINVADVDAFVVVELKKELVIAGLKKPAKPPPDAPIALRKTHKESAAGSGTIFPSAMINATSPISNAIIKNM